MYAANVSVVIPTYNRAGMVCNAVASALSQTLPPGEVIVVDDGSTDNTEAVLRARFSDGISYHRQGNQGAAAARNTGVDLARHPLIAFLDSDDIWMPEKLARQIPHMSDPSVVLSATNWARIGNPDAGAFQSFGHAVEELACLEYRPLSRLCSRRGHGILVQTTIIRRNLFLEIGGFDTTLRITEDMDLLFRMARHGTFVIHSEIMMLRGTAPEGNLTDTASRAWQAENLDNMINVLRRELSGRAGSNPVDRKALGRRLSQLLVIRAALACEGDDGYDLARGLYREGLRLPAASMDAIYCGLGSISPGLLLRCRASGRRLKNRLLRDERAFRT